MFIYFNRSNRGHGTSPHSLITHPASEQCNLLSIGGGQFFKFTTFRTLKITRITSFRICNVVYTPTSYRSHYSFLWFHILCSATVLYCMFYVPLILNSLTRTFFCVWCDFDRASSLICGNKMPTKYTKYHRQQPLYNTLELLMMGILLPETCWASNKICNKNLCCM